MMLSQRAQAGNRWTARLCAATMGVALLGVVTPAASADPKPTVDADVSAQASQLFAEGLTTAGKGQWEKARTFFLSAWRIQHHWKIAVNLGRAEFKANKMRDAAEHLTFFLQQAPSNIDKEQRKVIEEMLTQARAAVGAVQVTGAPAGADILVDGVSMGAAPLSGDVFLEPGSHRLEAKREGYRNAEETVQAVAGKRAAVDLRLMPLPPSVAGGGPVVGEQPVAAGPNKTVVIVGGALAVAGLGVGFGFMGASFAKGSELDKLPGKAACDANLDISCKSQAVLDAADARARFANLSVWTLVGAGVVGTGTLIYALMPRSPKAREGVKASVMMGPGLAMGTIAGSW